MAHHTLKTSYASLSDRLNRFPQGAPPSDLLFGILKILFSEKEAELVSTLPIKPFTAEKASRIWKMDATDARKVLDELVEPRHSGGYRAQWRDNLCAAATDGRLL